MSTNQRMQMTKFSRESTKRRNTTRRSQKLKAFSFFSVSVDMLKTQSHWDRVDMYM